MGSLRLDSDTALICAGEVNFGNASSMVYKAASIGSAEWKSSGSDNLVWNKYYHAFSKTAAFDLAVGGTPVVYEMIVFEARAAGVIDFAYAGLNESGSSTNIDFDAQLDGTTILTGDINVVHGTGDHTAVAGTLATTTFVAGALFTALVKTVTSSTGAQGPYLTLGFHYTAVPS